MNHINAELPSVLQGAHHYSEFSAWMVKPESEFDGVWVWDLDICEERRQTAEYLQSQGTNHATKWLDRTLGDGDRRVSRRLCEVPEKLWLVTVM